jgi:hypothetical protein
MLDEPAIFLNRVQDRKERQEAQRRRKDPGDGVGIVVGSRSAEEAFELH